MLSRTASEVLDDSFTQIATMWDIGIIARRQVKQSFTAQAMNQQPHQNKLRTNPFLV
jgi:hypothetical protein